MEFEKGFTFLSMPYLIYTFKYRLFIVILFYFFVVQSDQQESKSEQALQIIGHVVAESYANKRSKHGRRQFVVSNASL
jgi:hypothetical protein